MPIEDDLVRFRFDANQEYQLQAIGAAVDLFEGQPRVDVDLTTLALGPVPAVANRLDLAEDVLLRNVQAVQQAQGLPSDAELQVIEEGIQTAQGAETARFPNFSAEMETGTGKTYVYLRTALELFQRYGMRKYIVVVPSVAIREGVLKTLQITAEHFRGLYDNPPYRYYAYDSANLSQVRQFALSNGVEIMVMTLASFNKAGNVILQTTDRLQGETPIHLIQAARPILILDEPQNMESEKSVRALASLRPLFALRYSATHRNPYHLVHRLTPYEAYRQGLVKRIEVAGVEEVDSANQPFICVESIRSEKNTVTARLALQVLANDGRVKERTVTVRPGDDLRERTKRTTYAGWVVEEINPAWDVVRFANGQELRVGEASGADKEALWEAQVRYTIEEHLIKQRRLKQAGIKVLSLFFIDRVGNYAPQDGIIRQLFNRSFRALQAKYRDVCQGVWDSAEVDAEAVQAAYFAQSRKRGGQVVYEDSRSGESQRDKEAYDLIMKDKERLLSFDQKEAFIFSHSALREGWDNPNVFQICTLNQTASEMKKRQEIGRGVRLAVDQRGERIRDERVNVLTVVANESYERYVEGLQSEYAEDYPGQEPPKPPNARRRAVAHLNKERLLSPEFKELWERIKHKTRYRVKIDSERLIAEVVAALDAADIPPPRVAVTKAQVQVKDKETLYALQVSAAKTVVDLAGHYPLPNLVSLMEELMESTTPPVHLSRQTLLEVFKGTRQQQAAMDNPQGFASAAVHIIKERLAEQLVDGIQYEKINQWYEMTQFETELESWQEHMVPAPHGLYDAVVFESEVEREFVEGLEARADVLLYLKLPGWFTVRTPIGEYSPDWAMVMEPRDAHGQRTGQPLLYLVRETKASTEMGRLRPDEEKKIRCGKQHFEGALGVSYQVIPSASELT
jgi:type III restriction enzyme